MTEAELAALLTAWRVAGQPMWGPMWGPIWDALPGIPSFEECLSDDGVETGLTQVADRDPQRLGPASEGKKDTPGSGKTKVESPRKRDRSIHQRLVIRDSDHAFLKQLARTGSASSRHAELADLSPGRLRILVQEKVLREHDSIVRIRGELRSVRVLMLGSRGRNFVRRRMGMQLYSGNVRQAGHDLRLAEIYWSLPEAVRESWRTEGELIREWKQSGTYIKGEAVDAAVEVDGEQVAIEIAIGYGARDLAGKRAAIAKHFGGRGLLITEG